TLREVPVLWLATGTTTDTRTATRRIGRTLAVGAAIVLAYVAAAQFGLRFAAFGGSISPVWPASAVALAALVLAGLGFWPAVYLGAFLTSLLTGLPTSGALLTAAGGTLAAAGGAWLLGKLRFRRSIESPRDLVLLWLIGGGLATVVSATFGVTALRSSGAVSADAMAAAWRTWYFGDAAGVVLFAPLLLCALARPIGWPSVGELAELLGLLVATLAGAWLTFHPDAGYPYLPFVSLMWAVVRFDLRVTSLMCAVVAVFAAWETSHGRTQFVGTTPHEALIDTYRFVVIYAVVGLGFGSFVEQQRRTARALRASEARFRTAFRSGPNPKAIVSLGSGRIVDVSDAFAQTFGRSAQDFIGRLGTSVGLWVSPADRARFLEAASAGPVRGFAADLRAGDGSVRHVLITGERVEIDGEPHLLSIIQDITEYQALQQQLFQSQRMESVGALAGGVAHDFNNILTVILANAAFALRSLAPDHPAREDVEEVRRAGERGAALTRQLLAFSRRQPFEPQVLDLNAALADMERLLRRLLREDIQLVIRGAPELAHVCMDPAQIEQVVMNLVVNARDAMPGGGTLTVETANVEPDERDTAADAGGAHGPRVMLAVTDTGVGMDEATRERALEPFFTTKAAGRGTGLGLSTVYGIVRQGGGSIAITSAPGAGTTVRIYLPAVEEPVPEAARGATPVAERGSETILLVEDDRSIREIIRRILTGAGYVVLVAESPEDALRIAAAQAAPIHLLFTDVVMPGLRGAELAKRITGASPETKVLYTSGYAEGTVAPDGALGPGAQLLGKSFDAEQLLRKVRQVLDAADQPG
ncbi:MAG TPA: MASE1 domain-containing protein, partial [Gemmatimonadaceae bacterium]|nr:MASE1 domain-containing protein [Gemmatimonadaceae bacterium]